MEEEAACADDGETDVGDEEDAVMSVLDAVDAAFYGECNEEEIRQSIDNLGGIRCRIVVLNAVSVALR